MKKHTFIQTVFVASTLLLSAGQTSTADYKTDFYKAVNKQWLASHTIPEDKSSVSTFTDIKDVFIKNSQALMATLLKKEKRSADEQKIVDYYSSYIDMKSRNANGSSALKPILESIDAVKDYDGLSKLMIDLNTKGLTTPYGFIPMVDMNDATKYLIGVSQDGLGLQTKFYDGNSTAAETKLKNYKEYMHNMLSLAKFKDVNKTVENTMKVEHLLAKNSSTILDMKDIKNLNNPVDFKTLDKMLSNLNMPLLFKSRGFPTNGKINIVTLKYFETLNTVYKEIPIALWKDFLKTHVVTAMGRYLGDDFIEAGHQYAMKEGAASKMEPIEILAIRDMSSSLDYLYGKVYIEAYFTDSTKSKVESIVKSIIAEYKDAITHTNRFSEETKKAALLKINNMGFNIAYPSKWHDYSSLKTKKDDLIFNVQEMIKYTLNRNAEKIRNVTVDKDAWEGDAPQEVNAFYSPQSNKFILLAGILHAPFFDMNATDAANYGGIGMAIGHEVGHAFDQTGAQFDEKGNFKNWWTKEDLKKFTALNDALIAQANAFEVVPGVHANGKLEIGEIQADLSGTEIALRAYLRTLKDDKQKAQGVKDFYMQFAKIWKSKSHPKRLIMLNDSDPHPMAIYRINSTVKNMDPFYKAFDVKKGDGMYLAPEKRVHVWTEKKK